MIMFYANGRYAICETKDKITTGSVGLEVRFSFDETWDGLGKHAVFRGSGAARDMAIVQNRCTVPPEVLTAAGGHLQIGVYGSRTEGEQGSEELVQATPTIWADAGLIEPGAEKANIPSTPQTAELVDQILAAAQAAQEAAEDAAEIAQSVRDDADSGAFDGEDGAPGLDGTNGVSPTLTVGDITGGHRITITDASGTRTVDVMDGATGPTGAPGAPGADGYSPTVSVTDITGGHRVTITDKNGAHSFDVMDGQGGSSNPGADEVNWTGGELGQQEPPADVEQAVTVVYNTAAAKYAKPSGGIPKSDLASAVQTSLGKADTALQEGDLDPVWDEIDNKLDKYQGNAYRAVSLPMGHLDSTSTATVMTATVPGITELRDGVFVWLHNGVITSASGVTLNINGLGAKPIYNSLSGAVVTTTFTAASSYLFVYNPTRVSGGCWDMSYGYDVNTTYTPAKLGQGYAVCSTAAATAAKTASISSYTLVAGGIVAIKFNEDVPANATLNITSKGAKTIYYRGAPITAGVIKAGDVVTMIYSTYYHVLSIDRASVDANQGAANAGKFLVVGNDGIVAPVSMDVWQGGSY